MQLQWSSPAEDLSFAAWKCSHFMHKKHKKVFFLLFSSPFLIYISHHTYFPGECILGEQISQLHHFLDSNPGPSFISKFDSLFFPSWGPWAFAFGSFPNRLLTIFLLLPIHLAVPLTFSPYDQSLWIIFGFPLTLLLFWLQLWPVATWEYIEYRNVFCLWWRKLP